MTAQSEVLTSDTWVSCWTRGFRLVAIMERVQAGLLGQTVSAFGITGLYITFVLSAGRFLRLAVGNMRMRIPYDDLPNTSRLIALCQVGGQPSVDIS